MNHKINLLLIVLFVIFTNQCFAGIYPGINPSQHDDFIIQGKVTIQFEDTLDLQVKHSVNKSNRIVSFNLTSLDNLLNKYNVVDARPIFPMEKEKPPVNSGKVDLTRYYELTFSETVDINTIVKELNHDPNLRMCEPVLASPILAVPNDPDWQNQWAMSPNGPDPNFYTAWDLETGSDSIKFALIDTGILFNHRDLIGNIWVNPGEDLDNDGVVYDSDDFNGIDDDGNGYVDDVIGYDFFTGISIGVASGEDGDTPDNDPSDFHGHGTHVAGIAAAMNNNGLDVTGAAGGWFGGHKSFRGVQILCARVGARASNGGGYTNHNDVATAINYATNMGANVINASWGGGSTVVGLATSNAVLSGVTFLHAAGNSNSSIPNIIDNVLGVITVASTTNTDQKSGFSSFGSYVDVSAPGSNILSTYSSAYTPGTNTLGGTSMSSPLVGGLALLIRSQMPSLTKNQVDSLILHTADSVSLYHKNPTYVGQLGSGRIDALAALQDLANAKFSADITEGIAPLTVNFLDLSPNSPVGWNWTFGTGESSTEQNPQYTYTEPGIYDVSQIIDENNPLGFGEEHLKKYIWVRQDSLLGDSVETIENSNVIIPVYLKNTSQLKELRYVFTYENQFNVLFDSISNIGTRTEYFENVTIDNIDTINQKISILMQTDVSGGSHYLMPDTGIICNLYFTVGKSGGVGNVILDTTSLGSYSSKFVSIYGDFFPEGYKPAIISINRCCNGIRGNVDNDINNVIDISDLVALVDFIFHNGKAPLCEEEANVDGSGEVDISDLIVLVNYMFKKGNSPETYPKNCNND